MLTNRSRATMTITCLAAMLALATGCTAAADDEGTPLVEEESVSDWADVDEPAIVVDQSVRPRLLQAPSGPAGAAPPDRWKGPSTDGLQK